MDKRQKGGWRVRLCLPAAAIPREEKRGATRRGRGTISLLYWLDARKTKQAIYRLLVWFYQRGSRVRVREDGKEGHKDADEEAGGGRKQKKERGGKKKNLGNKSEHCKKAHRFSAAHPHGEEEGLSRSGAPNIRKTTEKRGKETGKGHDRSPIPPFSTKKDHPKVRGRKVYRVRLED